MNELAREATKPSEDVVALPQFLPTPGRGISWFLAIIAVYFAATIIYFVGIGIYLGVTQPGIGPEQIEAFMPEHLKSLNGITGMYFTQFVFLVPMLLVISHFKTQSFRYTLGFVSVPLKALGFWAGIWFLYMVASFFVDKLVHVPVDDFMHLMNGSKHLGLAVVTVLLAPIMEEMVFRGYLFKALRRTWLGFSGTLLITSLLFVLIHIGQYNAIVLGQLFVFALILGFAREKTGSIYTPWLLHMLNNLVATVVITYLGLL